MKQLIILFILLNAGLAFSQSGQLAKGNFYFDKGGFFQAISCYERVLGSEFDSPEMEKKLAYSYNFCGQFDKAENLYKKLIEKNTEAELLYELGYCLARQNKHDEANAYFQQFSVLKPTDSRAQLYRKDPGYLVKLMAAEPHFKVSKTTLNTDHADFGVYPIPGRTDAMIVSSRRFSYWGNPRWAGNNDQFLDLFTVNLAASTSEKAAKYLLKPLNSGMHEGPACFSADGKYMYYTADNRKPNGANLIHLKIYRATWKKWYLG